MRLWVELASLGSSIVSHPYSILNQGGAGFGSSFFCVPSMFDNSLVTLAQ